MKNGLLFLAILMNFGAITAQNVGVNNPNPTEALDVTGNINVTGKLMTNGIQPNADQVLTTNAAGQMAWMDKKNNYKNSKYFETLGVPVIFEVPTTAKDLLIEIWGAGGGGSQGGGGGAGGYILIYMPTNPGQLEINTGLGGTGFNGTDPATGGGSSTVSIPQANFWFPIASANGGNSATEIHNGSGGAILTINTTNMVYYYGQSGQKNNTDYQQINTNIFYKKIKYGNGGLAQGQNQKGGEGATAFFNNNNVLMDTNYAAQGFGVGEGGGGGYEFGSGGGKGRVIVYW